MHTNAFHTSAFHRIAVIFETITDFLPWIDLAEKLLPGPSEVYLWGAVTVPEQKSISEGALPARELRHALKQAAQISATVYAEADIYVGRAPLRRILNRFHEAHQQGDDPVDVLLLPWQGPHALTAGLTTDEILQQAPCDVVLLAGQPGPTEQPVLLSLRGGANTTLGLRVAKALAGDQPITLFHAARSSEAIPGLRALQEAEPKITRVVTVVNSLVESIALETAGHQAVVLGATFHQQTASASASGPIIRDLYAEVHDHLARPVVLVRAVHPENVEFHAPAPDAPDQPSPDPLPVDDLSTQVDRWFAERNFHSHEFEELRALVELKERQGLTISVGLPALNEAATVGAVIRTIQEKLVQQVPLVDEIVLIDSGSTDDTVAIAEAHGIPVHAHSAILPELGTYRGKGEALWKSLHVLQGDLIVWIDTDITNIHPRFVYGLLGPLLQQPAIQYVKGFYQRPIRIDGQLHAYGGGRVTELVARPLLNLFYPELSGFVQPLAGEYAGRRAALEAVPFFTGYGVETGLLIDLYHRYGLRALAQTDLEERVHRNQPLVNLSKMSFAIMQVFIARLEQRYSFSLLEQAHRSMKLIAYDAERFALDIAAITDVERPPMASVAAYQARRACPPHSEQGTLERLAYA